MNIGDGLTLQSRTIDGKTTSGIFLLPNKSTKSHKTTSKTVKKSTHYNNKLVDDAQKNIKYKPNYGGEITKKKNENTSNQSHKTRDVESKSLDNDVVFINDNARISIEERDSKAVKNKQLPNDLSKVRTKFTEKTSVPKHNRNANNSNDSVKKGSKEKKIASNEIKVDTNFVTLTQDQLNLILNLVKTKQEIDVASVIDKDNKSGEKTSENNKSSEGKRVEPTSIPGLDIEDSPRRDHKNESDKENDSKENVSKLLEKAKRGDTKSKPGSRTTSPPQQDNGSGEPVAIKEGGKKKEYTLGELSGTLGGFGSRDREKSRLEERRKKWIADLDEQVEKKKQLQKPHKRIDKEEVKSSSTVISKPNRPAQNTPSAAPRSAPSSASQKRKVDAVRSSTNVEHVHESLPSAIRSSFFLGEAAPREHAYSAKKRLDQQAWRDELEKQIKEKEKKKQETTRKIEDDSDMWSRHFETMNPVPEKIQQETATMTDSGAPPDDPHHTQAPPTQPQQSPRVPAPNSDHIAGIYLGEHTTHSTGVRAQSNYLRSMTALLDPSQLDAMELKRQKQLEHRKIIAEQVEEKRKIKETEIRAKREEEELEEKRLEEERTQLKNQFEKEKNKQQAMEEKRDRQTQELYQQMKEAQATALKEKFERRQQNLKSHGHDTSRLERTHKHVLEKNMPPHHFSPPPIEHIPSLNIHDVQTTSHHDLQMTPRGALVHHQDDHSPVTVMASSNQIPIKLEISLNSKQMQDFAAKGVQTDNVTKKSHRRNETLLEILSDSDADTEYMDLPYPSGRKADRRRRRTKPSDREQNARNRHYDRYSRANRPDDEEREDRGRKTHGPKPKWGVGEKKKQYVPASNKYVSSKREREERENRLRRREEQLLAEQARNQPERLTVTSKTKLDSYENLAANMPDNHRPRPRKERSRSPPVEISTYRPSKPSRNRSSSPPVPALVNQMRTDRSYETVQKSRPMQVQDRPETAISVTTEQAKYQSSKHSAHSPVPDTDDFVQYRRSDVILDPNQPQTRPNTEKEERNYSGGQFSPHLYQPQTNERSKDPLLNADVLKQKDRQDRILKEISILRQGLLLKQREVASYPVAVAMPDSGRNLPERTNDLSLT